MSTQDSVHNISERLDRLYEFDREPIPPSKLCGSGHFAGLYAGECTAATEFVIGASFVAVVKATNFEDCDDAPRRCFV